MKRIVWLTDVHLNFLLAHQIREFLGNLSRERPDAVLVGGDIAESQNICEYLGLLHESIAAPIYFVLGNHDFYHGSVAETRARVAAFCAERPRLHYLTVEEVAPLTPQVGLVGHDGWADGRTGDYARSLVKMHDFTLIAELAGLGKQPRWEVLKKLGDEAAAHFRRVLPLALQQYQEVMLLTHVPPLRAACWHQGTISDDWWSPHFTCQAVGEALIEIMSAHPNRQLTVLCGHTHGQGETRPLPNLQILTGGAEYGAPAVQRVFELA